MNSVLFISHDGFIGGSTVSLSYLVKKFKEEGYSVYVFLPAGSPAVDYLRSFGAECLHHPWFPRNSFQLSLHFTYQAGRHDLWGMSTLVLDLVRFIIGAAGMVLRMRQVRPAMVYLNEHVMISGAWAARLLGIPSVCHLRSRMIGKQFRIRRYLAMKALLSWNSRLFAITELEADQFLDIDRDARSKIDVVPEFLDGRNEISEGRWPSVRDRYGVSKEATVIVTFGGIHPIKGTEELLNAAGMLVHDRSDVAFVLVGRNFLGSEHPYTKACHSIIASLPAGTVTMIEEVTDATEVLAMSDILVSCNTDSHFSRPVIEAWAARKAVIVRSTPHAERLVHHQINGLVYQPGDPSALYRALTQLTSDPEERRRLGENGYRRAKENFGIDVNWPIIRQQLPTGSYD